MDETFPKIPFCTEFFLRMTYYAVSTAMQPRETTYTSIYSPIDLVGK